jgi:hypothetical protein
MKFMTPDAALMASEAMPIRSHIVAESHELDERASFNAIEGMPEDEREAEPAEPADVLRVPFIDGIGEDWVLLVENINPLAGLTGSEELDPMLLQEGSVEHPDDAGVRHVGLPYPEHAHRFSIRGDHGEALVGVEETEGEREVWFEPTVGSHLGHIFRTEPWGEVVDI